MRGRPGRGLAVLLLGVVGACGEGSPAGSDADCEESLRAALPALWAAWEVPGDEVSVWKALATGLQGRALTEAYVRSWRARTRATAEGTSVQPLGHDVQQVVPVAGASACVADVTWTLRVVLSHDDHAHPRALRHRARLSAEAGRIVQVVPLAIDTLPARTADPFLTEADAGGYLLAEELMAAGFLDSDAGDGGGGP